MRKLFILPLLLLATTAQRCDDELKTAYRTLAADKAAYEAATSEVARRFQAGEIPRERMEKLAQAAEKWGEAHNLATEALAQWAIFKNEQGKFNWSEAAARLAEAAIKFREAFNETND